MHLKPEHPVSQLTKVLRREVDNEKDIRSGARGGWDRFSWNDVRFMNYKDRELYLGFPAKVGFLDKQGKWKRSGWHQNVNRSKMNGDLVVSEGLSCLATKTKEEVQREDRKRLELALQGKTNEIFNKPSKT